VISNVLVLLRVLSRDSPSGEMKAVVRECSVKGEEKQFLEVRRCLLLVVLFISIELSL
jgi:hypothetical protein